MRVRYVHSVDTRLAMPGYIVHWYCTHAIDPVLGLGAILAQGMAPNTSQGPVIHFTALSFLALQQQDKHPEPTHIRHIPCRLCAAYLGPLSCLRLAY